MAKIFVAVAALLATVAAEPPVNSYLPPGRNGQPSSQYGPPEANGFGSRALSRSYGAPSNALDFAGRNGQAPSSRYGPPSANGFSQQPSSSYGVPEQNRNDFDFDSVTIDAASRSFNGNNHQQSARFGQPSQSYGAPRSNGNGFGSNGFQQPSSSYGAPARSAQPSSSYGAPARSNGNGFHSNGFGSNGNGFHSNGFNSNGYQQPSSSYGAPARSAQQPSSRYGAPSNGFGSNGFNNNNGAGRYTDAISRSYGAPSNGFGRSGAPSTSYGAPSNGFGRSSSSYSAPSNHLDAGYARQPSSEYGPPGYARKATTEDPLAEPANYQYNYEVRDEEQISGAEFGHQESREDESARGVYHVLLPDGRMQIVEYEADEEGYRPNIRYEETGAYPDARSGPYPDARNGNGHNGY